MGIGKSHLSFPHEYTCLFLGSTGGGSSFLSAFVATMKTDNSRRQVRSGIADPNIIVEVWDSLS